MYSLVGGRARRAWRAEKARLQSFAVQPLAPASRLQSYFQRLASHTGA